MIGVKQLAPGGMHELSNTGHNDNFAQPNNGPFFGRLSEWARELSLAGLTLCSHCVRLLALFAGLKRGTLLALFAGMKRGTKLSCLNNWAG